MHSVRKNSSCGPFTERRKLSYCLSSILASETTFRWTFRAKIMQLLPCAQLAILCPAEEGGILSGTIVQLGLYLMSQSLDNLPTILKKMALGAPEC